MWPFSKINKLETELRLVTDKLFDIKLSVDLNLEQEEGRYRNICRVLDIIVLEARQNNKSFTETMHMRMADLNIDLHQTAEEALTTAEIVSDVQVRIKQLENKLQQDNLLS